MDLRTIEIDEDLIVEAVKFAITNDFNLSDLSRLLVMEGGVDLDTLARIIREYQPEQDQKPLKLENQGEVISILNRISRHSSESQMPVDPWFGLKVAT